MLQAFDIPPTTTLTDLNGEGVIQVVFLHGWGANARDPMSWVSSLGLPYCHFWFPEAPFPHPQVPGGRAWFDLEKWQGLERSIDLLQGWLLNLEKLSEIPLSQTVLAGFSQGGAMALRVGLELEPTLAGVISLSGFLAGAPRIERRRSPMPPSLIVHGRQDSVVLVDLARQTKQVLEAIGARTEYYELDCGHEIPGAAIALVEQFLKRIPAAV